VMLHQPHQITAPESELRHVARQRHLTVERGCERVRPQPATFQALGRLRDRPVGCKFRPRPFPRATCGRRNRDLRGMCFWGSSISMNREELLQRIWIDPGRCSGKPCIRGHRIWVSLILDLLAAGESVEAILEDYPGISREDVQACIAYGSEMARERFVEIPLEPVGA